MSRLSWFLSFQGVFFLLALSLAAHPTPSALSITGNKIIYVVLGLGGLLIALAAWGLWIWSLKRALHEQNRQWQDELAERKRVEEQLRKNETLFRHIIDNMPVMMYSIHESGTIVFWNRECERVTGYLSKEIVGTPNPFVLFYPDDDYRQEIQNQWEKLGNNFRNWETEFTCKDGTRKIISWSTISDLAPIPGWFSWGIGVDVTERHMVEEDRRDLEGRVQNLQRIESLGVMAGGIAHDFNNLLMGILGNAELARLDLPENASTHEYLKDIEEASHSAAELCKQMLAFSGKGKFVIETVNLNNLLMQIDPIIRSLLSKNITFDLHCSDVPLYIEADSTQIRQLVMNLATNAVEAIDNSEGKISIVTGFMYCSDEYLNETLIQVSLQEGDYAFIEVSDDGCGIENKVMQKIFDPFFSTKFIGRGLGLPVVLGIVRGHNGTLRVYSERDHGTTVKALFPLSTKRPDVRLSGNGVLESWDTKGTVLVVDDDETVRNVAGRMLQKAGLDVIFASSGIEAVEKYQKERESIHCVLLDLTMPEMSGEDVFKKLHSIDPNVKVVLSSGYNEQDVSSRISINGFAGFIQKPYQSRKLYQILQTVITNQETN